MATYLSTVTDVVDRPGYHWWAAWSRASGWPPRGRPQSAGGSGPASSAAAPSHCAACSAPPASSWTPRRAHASAFAFAAPEALEKKHGGIFSFFTLMWRWPYATSCCRGRPFLLPVGLFQSLISQPELTVFIQSVNPSGPKKKKKQHLRL